MLSGGGPFRKACGTPRNATARPATAQLTPAPGATAATISTQMPVTSIVAGTRSAAMAGHQAATISANTTSARVHGCTPNSAMPIAATSGSKPPQPK